jgi:hypothetical protein
LAVLAPPVSRREAGPSRKHDCDIDERTGRAPGAGLARFRRGDYDSRCVPARTAAARRPGRKPGRPGRWPLLGCSFGRVRLWMLARAPTRALGRFDSRFSAAELIRPARRLDSYPRRRLHPARKGRAPFHDVSARPRYPHGPQPVTLRKFVLISRAGRRSTWTAIR